MKTCTKCKINKELSLFGKHKCMKDGLRSSCKECENKIASCSMKTIRGVITTIYGSQKQNSIARGHGLPLYTKKELSNWLLNDWLFSLLYSNWANLGYIKDMKPSMDRLDDNKGYSFDNIQITTWGENNSKGRCDIKSGKLINNHKAVLQFTKDGIFMQEFVSASEANRHFRGNIAACCRKKAKFAGGYAWKFKEA